MPKAFADKPIYVFETGGTTGVPKSRIAIEDFRTDYSLFSDTLPDEYFPKGANWLMLGPSGPRRLRLAVEHLAQYRGGICFCIDLDPRWVIKLIKKGWMEHLEAYKEHCIDQAITILGAGHDIKLHVHHAQAAGSRWPWRWRSEARASARHGITGIFSGGTEFTPQWTRFATEEFLDGVYMTPTYGNTLMGLACSKPVTAADGYKISYYAPQPRAVAEVVEFNDYEPSGRLRPDRPREADHADQRVLRARLPGTRRRRARSRLMRSIPGTASAACVRSTSWPKPRPSACIESSPIA